MITKSIRLHRWFAGFTTFGMAGFALAISLLLPAGAPAATIIATNNADITSPTTWPGGVPISGDANLWQTKGSGAGAALTWPGTPTNFTFYGQTLEITNGGSLNHSSASTTQYHINNVILDAGGKITHGANSAWNLAFDADGSTHMLQLNGGTIALANTSTSDTLIFSKVNLAGSGTVTITRTFAATNIIDFSAATVDTHLFTGIFTVTSGGFTTKPTIINLPAIIDSNESFELDITDGSSQWTNVNSIAVKTLKLWNNSSSTLDTIAPGSYTASSLGANYSTCFSLPSDSTHTIQVGHSLTYNANGGTGAPAFAWCNAAVTLDNGAGLTYANHIFNGWNTAAGGTGTAYAGGASLTLSSNTTLYAQWTLLTGTIIGPATFPAAIVAIFGTASSPTSVSITSSGTLGNIIATAPAGLEVSSDGVTYGSTATNPPAGGTLYARLSASAALGTYNSLNVVLSSAGASAVNVATTASGNIVATPHWAVAASGNWGTAINWFASTIASGSGDTADFSQVDITSDTTVHLDASRTVGNLIFGNTDVAPAANWIVDDNGSAGTNMLMLAGGTPTITVSNLGSGKTTTISAVVTNTVSLTKAGAGTLVFNPGANTDTVSNLLVSAGTAQVVGGTLTVSASGTPTTTATTTNGLVISGSSSVLTVAGGTVNTVGYVSVNSGGTLQINSGVFNDTSAELLIAYGGAGTVTLNGGTLNVNVLRVTQSAGGGTVNLNGGRFQLNSFDFGNNNSVGTVNFNGATVQAKISTASFTFVTNNLTYNVSTNGLVFDSQTNNVTIGSPLVHQSALGATTDGGLTKLGAGTLTLTNVNTYSGATFVTNGTLVLGGGALITNTPVITVASNAVFDVSSLSSAFTLAQAASQTLSNSAPGAIIRGTNNCSAGTLALVYDGKTPCFAQTNGGMTLSAGTTIKIKKTGAQLAAGSYTLITNTATGNPGFVAGAVNSAVTVDGNGASGTATLAVVNNRLVLTVAGGGAPGNFSGISLSGTGLTLSVTNGPANGVWTLLESTNLLLPVSQWWTNWTGNYDASGSLTTNILNVATNPAAFYLLK